jgi:hypothetical protein
VGQGAGALVWFTFVPIARRVSRRRLVQVSTATGAGGYVALLVAGLALPAGAIVAARDQDGRPAILIKEEGAGRLVLCTYPLELAIWRTAPADHTALVRLYGALSDLAGMVAR